MRARGASREGGGSELPIPGAFVRGQSSTLAAPLRRIRRRESRDTHGCPTGEVVVVFARGEDRWRSPLSDPGPGDGRKSLRCKGLRPASWITAPAVRASTAGRGGGTSTAYGDGPVEIVRLAPGTVCGPPPRTVTIKRLEFSNIVGVEPTGGSLPNAPSPSPPCHRTFLPPAERNFASTCSARSSRRPRSRS